jgi:hypothetical protein
MYSVQQLFTGLVVLSTAALLAVWTVLLSELDKLASSTPSVGTYRSTRDFILAATFMVGNIILMAFVKAISHSSSIHGPFYGGIIVMQAILASTFSFLAFFEAWSNASTYMPYYSSLTFDMLSGVRLQLTCVVLTCATVGVVISSLFDKPPCCKSAAAAAVACDHDENCAHAQRQHPHHRRHHQKHVDDTHFNETGVRIVSKGGQYASGDVHEAGWGLATQPERFSARAGMGPTYYVPTGKQFW